MPDLDRFQHFELVDIDDGNIVRDAVGADQQLFVGSEGQLPHALADQKIVENFVSFSIDHSDAVGGAQGHEGLLSILGDADADRLDRFGAKTRNFKYYLLDDLKCLVVDDADSAADLGTDPHLRIVALEFGEARALVDQDIVDDFVARRIDKMGHVGGLGGVDQHLAIGTDPHALGLDADGNFAEHRFRRHVDDGDEIVVFIGDVECFAIGAQNQELGVGTGRKRAYALVGRGVDHFDGIVVAGADQYKLAVAGNGDAARTLADFHRLHGFHGGGIDDGDGVVFFIGDIDRISTGLSRPKAARQT